MSLRKTLFAASALVGLALAAPVAQAAVIGTIPGVGVVPNNNQVMAPLTKAEGWYGANVYLIGGPSQITATLIGFEAGWTNRFFWGGAQTFVTTAQQLGTLGAPIGTQVVLSNVLSGLLPFVFATNGGGNATAAAAGTVANGANFMPASGRGNFFVTFGTCPQIACIDTTINGSTAAGGTVAWLFFDDTGGRVDDNHDDLVVRLEITGGRIVIPTPASFALLGVGLLGLAAIARRRRAA